MEGQKTVQVILAQICPNIVSLGQKLKLQKKLDITQIWIVETLLSEQLASLLNIFSNFPGGWE